MEGTSVTLTAEFDPVVGPVQFRWSKDGVALPNQLGPSVRLSPVQISDAGSYTVEVSNTGGTAKSAPAALRVAAVNPSRISHFSLTAAGSPMIVGMGLTEGKTEASTPYLIRAAGPALEQFKISSFLRDPRLKVITAGAVLAENDNWISSPDQIAAQAAAQAFAFRSGSLDAALLLPLRSGNYTTQLSDPNGNRNLGMLELYDLSAAAHYHHPRLTTISARLLILPNEKVITAGFTIRGGASLRIMARAVGPGLSQLGVSNVLANPALALYRGTTVIASNDNWRDANVAMLDTAAQQAGAFALPRDSNDAALVTLLPPGYYTLRLENPENGGGIALFELYELP